MGQRREILERLEALERQTRSRNDDRCGGGHRDHCGHHHDHHDHGHGHDRGGDFDEKRVIDTIVGLVSEHVGQMLERHQAANQNRDDEGGEKRIVDLIVACVSEHVQEIVATELDKRLGRPDAKGGDERPAGKAPSRPRGGSAEPEPS